MRRLNIFISGYSHKSNRNCYWAVYQVYRKKKTFRPPPWKSHLKVTRFFPLFYFMLHMQSGCRCGSIHTFFLSFFLSLPLSPTFFSFFYSIRFAHWELRSREGRFERRCWSPAECGGVSIGLHAPERLCYAAECGVLHHPTKRVSLGTQTQKKTLPPEFNVPADASQ